MKRLLYRPLGMGASLAGGLLAGAIFRRTWSAMGHRDGPPNPTEKHRRWTEVLTAAALQGLIFGLVQAAVDRGAAAGVERVTGTWPGKE